MTNRPWHKRYQSDALNGYMALSLELRGAYTTLLDLMYDRGEPLVENERLLAGFMNVSVRKVRSIIAELIEADKIQRTEDGKLTNRRFEKERENELKISRKRAESAVKHPRKSRETSENPNEINDAPEANAQQKVPYARAFQKLEVRKQKTNNNNGPPPQAGASSSDLSQDYAFAGRVIRLNQRDFDCWRQAYRRIDLTQELTALDDWLAFQAPPEKRKSWFSLASGALRKKNEALRPRADEDENPYVFRM